MSCPRGCCANYREHLLGVTISAGRQPKNVAEAQLGKDLDAYKRLVQSGVQPKGIDGSAELERGANAKHEVENRNLITDPQLRGKVTRMFEQAAPPVLTPLDAA